jgi:hypothetical protein
MVMRLWSTAFAEEEPIPIEYTKDGQNISPPFDWADLPRGACELALIFEGITPATREPWVHWLAYKISGDAGGLPEGYQHRHGPEEPVPILQAAIRWEMSVMMARRAPSAALSATASACSRSTSRCKPRLACTAGHWRG